MRKELVILICSICMHCTLTAQTLSQQQMINARATGYAIVASRNPGQSFSVYMIPWDGVNTLEYNANNQINYGWHAQAAIKGNFFNQTFDGSDFSLYSTVLCSQAEFDQYKNKGTQWWIVCSTLPPFSQSISSNSLGNVGIGTSSPTERLCVNGNIKTKKLIVTQTGWADFVFKPNYKLASLSELETYIKEHQHLPEVPTENEIKENGVDIGDTQILLLKKVEELTLYLIEQNKSVHKLIKENEQLKQENIEIKKQIQKLKNII